MFPTESSAGNSKAQYFFLTVRFPSHVLCEEVAHADHGLLFRICSKRIRTARHMVLPLYSRKQDILRITTCIFLHYPSLHLLSLSQLFPTLLNIEF